MLTKLRHMVKSTLLSAMPSPWKRQDIARVAIQTCDGFDLALWTGALDRELPDWPERIELLCVPGDFAFAHAASDADACTTMTLTPALFGHARLKWINTMPAAIPRPGTCKPNSRSEIPCVSPSISRNVQTSASKLTVRNHRSLRDRLIHRVTIPSMG